MPLSKYVRPLIHKDRRVIEIMGPGPDHSENLKLLDACTSQLRRLGPKKRALLLLDFSNATYSVHTALAWKNQLGFFSDRVEKSAIFGADSLHRIAISGYVQTAQLMGYPLGPNRARLFENREKALDWLTA